MFKFTKLRFTWIVAVFLTVGFLCGAPALANEENETAGAGYDQAQQQLEDALADVAANRTAYENDLAQRCAPAWGEDVDNAVAALAGLNDADLLAADEASDCDAARSIVEGEPVDLPVELLGDTTQDWVYTAVNPCVIVDTRSAGGPIFSGSQRNFFVYGSLGSQGGASCSLPSGKPEPRGVHINLIAIPVGGKGNVRAFPYLNPTTDGLSANFNTVNNVNVANAGTIKSCYLCGPEITVRSSNGSANVKIEVLGYYYPADIPDGSDFAASSDNEIELLTTDKTVKSVVISAPSSGKVIVNASGYFVHTSSLTVDGARCSITTGTAVDFTHLIISGESTANAVNYASFAATRGYNVSAGNTTFRLVCNEYTGNVRVGDPTMTAIFQRNTR